MQHHILTLILFAHTAIAYGAAFENNENILTLTGHDNISAQLSVSAAKHAEYLYNIIEEFGSKNSIDLPLKRYSGAHLQTIAELLHIRSKTTAFEELTAAYTHQISSGATALNALETGDYFCFDSHIMAALGHVFAQKQLCVQSPEEKADICSALKNLSPVQMQNILPFIASAYYQQSNRDLNKLPKAYAQAIIQKREHALRLNINPLVLSRIKTMRCIRHIEYDQFTWGAPVAFTSDNAFLAYAPEDGSIYIWNAQKKDVEPLRVMPAHRKSVKKIIFRPGTHEFASSTFSEPFVKIWDLENPANEPIHAFSHESEPKIIALAYSRNGLMIASGSENGDLIIRATSQPYEILHQLCIDKPENNHKISAIAFNPDNQTLAAASGDNKIRIWRLSNTTIEKELTEHTDNIRPLFYSADGTKLVSGSADTSIIIWDLANSSMVKKIVLGKDQLGYPIFIHSVLLSPNSDMLIAALSDCSIRFWDTRDYTEIFATGTQGCKQPRNLALSSDGKILAAGCQYGLFTWKLPIAVAADLPYLQFELLKKAARHYNELKEQFPITDTETWQMYDRLPAMFKSANLFCIEPTLQAEMQARYHIRTRQSLL